MRLAFSLLAPGGILTGDDYDKYFPAVQQSVNEFVATLPPTELDDPRLWASTWRGRRRLRRVEADGVVLPLILRSGQWMIKRRASSAAKRRASSAASSAASAETAAGLAGAGVQAGHLSGWSGDEPPPLVQCCIGGWADPLVHTIGRPWCAGSPERTAKCEVSRRRSAWYTTCAPRAAASRTAQLLSTGQAKVRGRARVPIRVWVSQSPRHASLQRQWHALYQTRRTGPAASFWLHLTALRSRDGGIRTYLCAGNGGEWLER